MKEQLHEPSPYPRPLHFCVCAARHRAAIPDQAGARASRLRGGKLDRHRRTRDGGPSRRLLEADGNRREPRRGGGQSRRGRGRQGAGRRLHPALRAERPRDQRGRAAESAVQGRDGPRADRAGGGDSAHPDRGPRLSGEERAGVDSAREGRAGQADLCLLGCRQFRSPVRRAVQHDGRNHRDPCSLQGRRAGGAGRDSGARRLLLRRHAGRPAARKFGAGAGARCHEQAALPRRTERADRRRAGPASVRGDAVERLLRAGVDPTRAWGAYRTRRRGRPQAARDAGNAGESRRRALRGQPGELQEILPRRHREVEEPREGHPSQARIGAWRCVSHWADTRRHSRPPMSRKGRKPFALTKSHARRIWLRAQRLDESAPFGYGPGAIRAAVEHLGYVQIDTINVIERCHHQILYTRIPGYRREDLRQAQTVDKTVFEYWTHALSYVPTRDLRFYLGDMKRYRRDRSPWFAAVKEEDLRRVLALIRKQGALTIRDIDDDVLVEKEHPWASRKPSKRALQMAFYQGVVTISQRTGMLKTYELTSRHFGWERPPKAASEREVLNYLLDRALRSQGVVSVDSACYLDARRKPAMRRLIETRVRRKELVPVEIEGAGTLQHWVRPEALDATFDAAHESVHILSPFDPLIHQRKRLHLFFDYEHRFEAYVPKDKRLFGYFAQPVLVGDEIVAVVDLKTDRERRKLLVQRWTWVSNRSRSLRRRRIEEALHCFERFQLAR